MIGSGEVRIQRVRILDESGRERKRFRTGEALSVAVTFRTTELVPRPIPGIALHRNDGVYVYGPNTRFDGVLQAASTASTPSSSTILFSPAQRNLPGERRGLRRAAPAPRLVQPDVREEVVQEVEDHGVLQLPHSWGLITHWRGREFSERVGGLRADGASLHHRYGAPLDPEAER